MATNTETTETTPTRTTDNGYEAVPDRYAGNGREVVDRWRDDAHAVADALADQVGGDDDFRARMANTLYAYALLTHVTKYRLRAGAKGDPKGDEDKADFYEALARHVVHPSTHPDPRCNRPGFQPYKRQPVQG